MYYETKKILAEERKSNNFLIDGETSEPENSLILSKFTKKTLKNKDNLHLKNSMKRVR